jgi:metallo-beta-lactamase family protein
LFQGGKREKAKNRRPDKLEGGRLDAVVLTHGHLDHVGRLPLLTRNGYEGPIYSTRPTIDLATLILRDSLSLQKADLKRENKKRNRDGLPPLEPLFATNDVRRPNRSSRPSPIANVRGGRESGRGWWTLGT